MITVEQIRAGRALLDWNQDDLAKFAGMSKPAIANLERRTSTPRVETLVAIQKALEQAGIEFTEGPGVKLNSHTLTVQVFKGSDSIQRLWNDILETLKPGDERLISGVSEDKYLAATGAKFPKMMKKYQAQNISGRILSLEGDKNFADFTSQYRWVPRMLFTDIPYYIYANKYATLIWEPEPSVVLIENKAVADSYRAQFERHWAAAQIPPKTISG